MENSTANADHVIQNEEKHVKVEIPQNLLTEDFEEFELLVQSDKHREVNLKRKLLELNGLKEEQSAISQLQRLLEKKTAKLDSLKINIASLQADMREKIKDVVSKKQLDIAKKMMNEMQRKKDVNGRSPAKEQMLMLQQQVAELEEYNSSARDAIVNKKLEEVKGVELEVLELKRRNRA